MGVRAAGPSVRQVTNGSCDQDCDVVFKEQAGSPAEIRQQGNKTMSNGRLDIDAARRLVEDISKNLATLPKDSAKHRELRAEVEELKAMLGEADAHPPVIEDKMRSVHSLFGRATSELQADGIRAGIFLREIGRMLGLD